MTDAELAHTKELAFWMVDRVFMNPISAKLLNEDWRKAFPDEVAVAERMKALVEALEKAQQRIAELERGQETLLPVGVMSEKAFRRLENSESRFIALWPRPGIFLPRKRPEDGVIVYARTAVDAVTREAE